MILKCFVSGYVVFVVYVQNDGLRVETEYSSVGTVKVKEREGDNGGYPLVRSLPR